MTRKTLLLALFSLPSSAQFPVNPANFPQFERVFQAAPAAAQMKCSFQSKSLLLGFSLRYDAGYLIQFPNNELTGPGHTIDIAIKVIPLTGTAAPFFLASHLNLPANATSDVSGSFRIDPGSYRIEALAVDDAARVCRGEWKLETKPLPAPRSQATGRVTIILDAAPVDSRLVTLPPEDIAMLTGAVSALTRNLVVPSLRVVVLNLDTKKEFLRLNSFTRADSRRLRSTLSALQFATVDYRDRERVLDPSVYLANLLAQEAEDSTQTVIFLGAQSRTHQGFAADAFSNRQKALPACYYLQYQKPRHVMDSGYLLDDPPGNRHPRLPDPIGLDRDTIERLMQKVHGHTLLFSTPKELARAIDRLTSASRRASP